VNLINLRQHATDRMRLESLGFDLDEGMVLDLHGHLYSGGDAVHQLALLTTGSNFFNSAVSTLLRRHLIAKLLYPLLRLGRATTLLVLDRPTLRTHDDADGPRRELFCMAWALFAY